MPDNIMEAVPSGKASFFIDARINPKLPPKLEGEAVTAVYDAFSLCLETKYESALRKKIISFLRKEKNISMDFPESEIGTAEEIESYAKKVEEELRKFCRSSDIKIKISFSSEMPKEHSENSAETGCAYFCSMCQNLSMHHICVITDSSQGQCGSMSASDAELMIGLSPNGPCRKTKLIHELDKEKGEWKEINETAEELTFGRIKRITLNSITDFPMPMSPLAETAVISDGETELAIDRKDQESEFMGISYHEAISICIGRGQIPGITGRARISKNIK
ncbi:MAG: hypothetical protein MJ234_00835 [bacterium]|nr:hypothetical protein [bacterium]